ncbi:NAD(P)/FAD-dependent oxidoreductase [Agrococcus baldri]|uniref:Thioredoxin reductase n=1 Tax=Agrococcus baldri TaxID=153730 RepID=A0AA87RHN3_9MICO|nr:NAD(P)/FAD-dependent oxidoreductase [Agrococcus baldri]GEK80485.1 thioredoxin reductase [Agrococcus baldri]
MTSPSSSPVWDAIVVGGSAAGLSAALMLGRSRRRVLVIDAGAPRNRFAQHMHGVLGNEGTPPAELVRRGRAEVAAYGVELRDGAVERVTTTDAGLAVALAGGATERSRALIVATGITDALPDIPGLAEHWGTGVLHCPYCHGWEVRDRRIGVLAASPMAAHQARLVRQLSDRVVLFSAALGALEPAEEQRLRSRDIEIVAAPVLEVVGDGGTIRGVRTADGRVTEVDAIFTAGAPRPHDAFLAGLDLPRTEQPFGLGSFLTVDQTGRTGHERIWAIGNVVSPMANVPMVMAAGAMTGSAVNGALVEEDFELAVGPAPAVTDAAGTRGAAA